MKILFVLVSIFNVIQATSQDLALENTRAKGSTRLYVGVVNALLIKGNTNKIVHVRADSAEIQRNNDTLFIRPVLPGELKLFIETEGGTSEYAFTSNYLPPPQLMIDTTKLAVGSLLSGAAFSIAQTDPDRLYANCVVCEFDLAIGNTTVNSRSTEARSALLNRKPYYKVYLNKFVLIDTNTGRKRTVRCHRELKVL